MQDPAPSQLAALAASAQTKQVKHLGHGLMRGGGGFGIGTVNKYVLSRRSVMDESPRD